MKRHKKKITKQRGTRSVGRGRSKRGRGRGSRMARGSVKRGQRNIMHIHKYQPERFAKKGFASIKKKGKAINLRDIEKLTDKNEIDVTKHKIDKVLGVGELSKAMKITAKSFTAKAKEKIEKAGGQAIVLGENIG